MPQVHPLRSEQAGTFRPTMKYMPAPDCVGLGHATLYSQLPRCPTLR